MANDTLKSLSGPGRRHFLKWSAAVAAALGLERTRFLDVLHGTAGSALADEAKCGSSARSVHIIAGNGGLAWFTQLFAYPDIARAGNAAFAYAGAANAVKTAATDNPLVYSEYSPFQRLGKRQQVTAFIAGTNQTHTNTPSNGLTLGSNGLIAAIAAMQSTNPSLLPVIAINPFVFGAAPGSPTPATVANSAGLIDLFNSAASRTLLADQKNANLQEAYYKAFLNLNAASGRQTQTRTYGTGKVAMNLLGKNLADQLKPTAADDARYGILASTPNNVREIARALIIGVKAFKLGLTNSLIIPAMRDDPHGAFQNMQALNATVMALGKSLDAFMADCMATADPSCESKSLGENIVMTITGDTPKSARVRNGWPDGTDGNHNVVYAMGNGYLKTGWLGNLSATGAVSTWNPDTGATIQGGSSSAMATPAAAAIAYAVAKGDTRRVTDFGVTIPKGVVVAPTP